jgi:hypothetical protein
LATASPLKGDGTFGAHWKERESAMKELFEYKVQKKQKQTQSRRSRRSGMRILGKQNYRTEVDDARAKMDACNRFSIFVRGSSPEVYGALDKANITDQFAHLVK